MLSLSVFAVIISSSHATACSVCVTAQIDSILPPVGLWSLFAVVWFFALACLVRIRHEYVKGVPSVIWAIGLVLGLGMMGIIGLGPVGLLILLWSPLRIAVQIFLGKGRRYWSQPLTRDLTIVTVAGLVVFVGLSAYSAYIQHVRSPADYVLQWESTFPAHRVLQQLESRGPEALPDLRYLVAHSKPATVAQLVDSIAALGQPETDIPLLILALGRCQHSRACEADVSAALRKLSGLDLADGTSAKSWQEHWHRRLAHKSAVLHR